MKIMVIKNTGMHAWIQNLCILFDKVVIFVFAVDKMQDTGVSWRLTCRISNDKAVVNLRIAAGIMQIYKCEKAQASKQKH